MNIYEKEIIVKKEDIDFNNHVNNLKYLEWMINSAMEHSTKEGFGVLFYKKKGVSWIAKKHCIEYKLPAFEGDRLVLRTWIDEVKRVSVIRRYEIYKDNKLVAFGFSEWVFVDFDTQKPKRIPKEIIEKFVG